MPITAQSIRRQEGLWKYKIRSLLPSRIENHSKPNAPYSKMSTEEDKSKIALTGGEEVQKFENPQNSIDVPKIDKGKGKAKAVEPTEEDGEDDDEEDEDEEDEDDDLDEDLDDLLDEVDVTEIIPPSRQRSSRNKVIDYSSAEAMQKAGIDNGNGGENENSSITNKLAFSNDHEDEENDEDYKGDETMEED